VLAHRGIDAAADADLVVLDHPLVELLAHAVQALELEVSIVARELEYARDRMRVVRGQLWIEHVGVVEQLARTCEKGHVGVDLAREHRVVLHAQFLGALDLHVPIGALHQSHHEATSVAPGHVGQEVEHVRGAFQVALDDDAEALPVLQLGIARDGFDAVERDIQPIGLLGIDVEADVVVGCIDTERAQARHELVHHALMVGHFVARVQTRKLHRDARAFDRATPASGFANLLDRVLVTAEIVLGVLHRARRLAQHVVGVGVAPLLPPLGALDRSLDLAGHHELPTHDAHRLVHGFAHDRLAHARDQAAQRGIRRPPARIVHAHHLAGHHQRPGRGIDKQRARMAEMLFPVGTAELVADQALPGLGIGDSQQCLGDAHEQHAFVRGQAVFMQECIDTTLVPRILANRLDQ